MVNTEDFVKRLEMLFEHFGLTAASFSDRIGVQRSGVSHLLSGRNKPSLDFVMKINHYFPDVDIFWLLNGTGDLLKESAPSLSPVQKIDNPPPSPIAERLKNDKDIVKVILLHADGSFTEYSPEK
jgi:transcriptional regulator with XRE-family HTH domain